MSEKASPDDALAEIKTDAGWQAIDAAAARLSPSGSLIRCRSCHGRVIVHGGFAARGYLLFRHWRSHDGCPHMPARYEGNPSTHPMALS